MIYFFKDTGNGAIKIGYTGANDPKERLSQCQTGNPNKLICLGTIPGDKEYEAILHNCFHDHHLSGEWYNISEKQVAELLLEKLEYKEEQEEEEINDIIVKKAKKLFKKHPEMSNWPSSLWRELALIEDADTIEKLLEDIEGITEWFKDKGFDNSRELRGVNFKGIFHVNGKETIQIQPQFNIQIILDQEAEEIVRKRVNEKTTRVLTEHIRTLEKQFLEIKSDSNAFFVKKYMEAEQELQKKEKEFEKLKKENKTLKEQLENTPKENENLSTKEDTKKILKQLLETL